MVKAVEEKVYGGTVLLLTAEKNELDKEVNKAGKDDG